MEYCNTEQWVSGGDCKVCRRWKYCNTTCKQARLHNTRMLYGMVQRAIADTVIEMDRRESRRRKMGSYYKSRRAYAVIDGAVVWADDEGFGNMTTHDWLVGHRGMSEEEFERTVRGAIHSDHATICVGKECECVVIDDLPDGVLMQVAKKAGDVFGCDVIEFQNGAMPGEPGTIWEPREVIAVFSCK